jgi:hypothetical protein
LSGAKPNSSASGRRWPWSTRRNDLKERHDMPLLAVIGCGVASVFQIRKNRWFRLAMRALIWGGTGPESTSSQRSASNIQGYLCQALRSMCVGRLSRTILSLISERFSGLKRCLFTSAQMNWRFAFRASSMSLLRVGTITCAAARTWIAC